MPVVPDILASWRRPATVMRRKLAKGPQESQALATLMGAALLHFVAQWPGLARAAHLEPSVPLDARLGGALLGTVFMLPLFAYLLALVSQFAVRLLGWRVDGLAARLALFWALLAASPLVLLVGLVSGFAGPGASTSFAGLIWLGLFLWMWFSNLRAARGEA